MKIVYVGVPNEFVSEGDAVALTIRDVPGVGIRPISIPHLAALDLQDSGGVFNPPDDMIRFWINERRRFDRLFWVRKFLEYVKTATKKSSKPICVVLLVGCADDPALHQLMELVYGGNLKELVEDLKAIIEFKRRG